MQRLTIPKLRIWHPEDLIGVSAYKQFISKPKRPIAVFPIFKPGQYINTWMVHIEEVRNPHLAGPILQKQ